MFYDDFQGLTVFRTLCIREHHLGLAGNHRQRVVDFMGRTGRHFSDADEAFGPAVMAMTELLFPYGRCKRLGFIIDAADGTAPREGGTGTLHKAHEITQETIGKIG